MATLVSIANGNFTTNTTWGVSDATAELDSVANSSVVDTTNRDSAAHLEHENGIYSGICLKVYQRAASPAGTLKVVLLNSSDNLEVASVTVNVSDLPMFGWVYFKFGSPFTTTNGKNYKVRCVCSNSGSQVTLYRDGTAYNWTKIVVSTTNAVPAAADKLIILGNITAAGSWTTTTVDMDSVASTNSYGPTVSGGPPWGIGICKNGTLAFKYAASTTYKLKWKGLLYITEGGKLTVGTAANPIPSTSSAELIADAVADGDTGIIVDGGDFQTYGAAKKSWCLLTADAAASQKVLTVEDTTGWAANDVLYLTPTGHADNTHENPVIATVDSSTQITASSNLTSAHKGGSTAVVQGAVGNLTRNTKLYGPSASLRTFVYFSKQQGIGGTGSLYYTEFTYVGANATNKYGLSVLGANDAAIAVYHCSFRYGAQVLYIASGGAGFDARYNVIHDWSYAALMVELTNPSNGWKMRDNLCGKLNASWNYGWFIGHFGGTFTNNRVYGITTSYSNPGEFRGLTGDLTQAVFEDNWICSSAGGFWMPTGSSMAIGIDMLVSRCHIRNCTYGFIHANGVPARLRFVECDVAGSDAAVTLYNASVMRGAPLHYLRCQFAGSAVKNMTKLLDVGGGNGQIIFEDCIYAANSVANFVDPTAANTPIAAGTWELRVLLTNCKFAAGLTAPWTYTGVNTAIGYLDQLSNFELADFDLPHVILERHNQVEGAHRSVWGQRGVIEPDSVIYKAAAPSERVYPKVILTTAVLNKMWSGQKAIAVASGGTATVKVWVRKSAAGDTGGYDYAGAQPRLMIRRNHAAGYDVDTVAATMSAAVGNWEQLTASIAAVPRDCVLQLYVDCDGRQGWINTDDWEVT